MVTFIYSIFTPKLEGNMIRYTPINRREFLGKVMAGAIWPAIAGISAGLTKAQEMTRVEQTIGTHYTNSVAYKGWVENLREGEKITKENPSFVREIVKKALNDKTEGNLEDYADCPEQFSKRNLFFLVYLNRFYNQRAPQLLEHPLYPVINVTSSRGIELDSLFDTYLFRRTGRAVKVFGEVFQNENVLCKTVSASYCANRLARRARGEEDSKEPIKLVTGVLFSPMNPSGVGHQWTKIGSEIVDPSLYPNQKEMSSAEYIPIVESEVDLKGFDPRKLTIYCFPRKD
jgi:hypothetical protein